MAHKTSALVGLYTALIDVEPLVAFGAIIHFHAIPGIALKAGDVLAPDIPTVSGNAVGFILFQALRLSDRAMAGDAVHLTHFDVGHMGEKHTIRLPRID